jgi:hypothetical protein
MKYKIKNKKASGLGIGLTSAIVIATIILAYTVPWQVPEMTNNGLQWHQIGMVTFTSADENFTIGAGASGIMEFYVINHSGVGSVFYTVNNTGVFEDACNATWGTLTTKGYTNQSSWWNIEIKPGIALDFLVRCRINKTNCANTTDSYGVYNLGRVRCNMTTSGGLASGAIADVTMDKAESGNNTAYPYLYVNFYLNNTNAGYQLNANGVCTVTEIHLEAMY